ncbi:DUF826 domain-containing protein [Salmonella enterica subsp. enterica serovar Denver]|nr:DUF826 domain-containing protein [Salmonella enterica subsp. enterica serovar Denver]ECD5430255.1 DUF826 domain-containing protein [Salmonella enterica subsp. enterica serovar Denver]
MAEKPRPYGAKRNADMKDIVTDDMVKNALKSDAVTIAVKTQIKSTLDQQIDAAVDTALTDILGSDADNTVMQ